ncbi:MAG: class I SAM-dependent methyltransferase [Candidatus Nanopelagicales bacterium]
MQRRTNSPAEWDERYSESEQVWSGEPNGTLIAEVAGLRPARALDIGCGEGADAVWLAKQGWEVTGLDVTKVALERAARHAADVGVEVRWVLSGLPGAAEDPAGFDLVSLQYPALLRTPADDSEHWILRAVAPDGTLLMVHHTFGDHEHARERAFDPADYVFPADMLPLLSDDWAIEVFEERSRTVSGGAGADHTRDQVLKARRLR